MLLREISQSEKATHLMIPPMGCSGKGNTIEMVKKKNQHYQGLGAGER